MNKSNAKAALTALALTVLSTCALADWTKVSTSDDGKVTSYADTNTLLVLGAKVQLLTMTDYQEVQTISAEQKFKSAKMQDEFNCDDATGRHLNLSAMSDNMGKGSTVAAEMKPAPTRQIKLDSPDGDMLKFVCAKK
ncbi:MAG: surface-adhesin E family protein [Burkholderiaceae bacterium]